MTVLSFCKHPNIVKLLHASFDGTLLIEDLRPDPLLGEMQLRKASVE